MVLVHFFLFYYLASSILKSTPSEYNVFFLQRIIFLHSYHPMRACVCVFCFVARQSYFSATSFSIFLKKLIPTHKPHWLTGFLVKKCLIVVENLVVELVQTINGIGHFNATINQTITLSIVFEALRFPFNC